MNSDIQQNSFIQPKQQQIRTEKPDLPGKDLLTQPNDAQLHLLKALSQKKGKEQKNDVFQFQQMNQTLEYNPYNMIQNYYYNEELQQYVYIGDQRQVQQESVQEQRERGGNRGRGRGRNGKQWKNKNYHGRKEGNWKNNHYHHHQGYHHPPHFEQFQPQGQFYPHPPPHHFPHPPHQFFQHPYTQGDNNQRHPFPPHPMMEFWRHQNQNRNFSSENYTPHQKEQESGYGFKPKQSKKKIPQKWFKKSSSQNEEDSDSNDEQNVVKSQYIEEITNYYRNQLCDFFEKKNVSQRQREGILRFLRNKYPKFNAQIKDILLAIKHLQKQNLIIHLQYKRVIQVLVNNRFEYETVVNKLQMIQQKKLRRLDADQTFQNKYGKIQMNPMMDHHDLLKHNVDDMFILIDGNNIFPTSKHFRKYFMSYNLEEKIQAQIRLRWFVSIALNCENVILFFDEKFPEDAVKAVEDAIIPNKEQYERMSKIQVIYGQNEKADEKIVKKCEELASLQNIQKKFVLISSDRQLYIRCNQQIQIDHAGGRFFFKFLGKTARNNCKKNKEKKRILQTILHAEQD